MAHTEQSAITRAEYLSRGIFESVVVLGLLTGWALSAFLSDLTREITALGNRWMGLVMIGKFPSLVTFFCITLRLTFIQADEVRHDRHAHTNVSTQPGYADILGSVWVASVAWSLSLIATVVGYRIGLEANSLGDASHLFRAVLLEAELTGLGRGLARTMLVASVLAWLFHAHQRIGVDLRMRPSTQMTGFLIIAAVIVVSAELIDSILFF
jgi:hypothetical protein